MKRNGSSPALHLQPRFPELIAAIEAGKCPAWARADVTSILDSALAEARLHHDIAIRISRERSERIRAPIVEARGSLPLDQRGLAGMVRRRIEKRGLKPPAAATVYRVLRGLREAEGGAGTANASVAAGRISIADHSQARSRTTTSALSSTLTRRFLIWL